MFIHAENLCTVNLEEFILAKEWADAFYEYVHLFVEYVIGVTYFLYVRLTLVNLIIFSVKYLPTGYYVFKLIKDVYSNSRHRIKDRQSEIEDIQLQIKIVKTKLCFRDAEFNERSEQLRRSTQRLRVLRERVRELIANNESVRETLQTATQWNAEHDAHFHYSSKDPDQFMVELIGKIHNESGASNIDVPQKVYKENSKTDSHSSVNSVYSSLSDVDLRQDYRVKIVKVTNVYKVAYLKNYMKQKKLRRANKQALLKKKMENIKNLLEDWQRTLNMVINSKMTILNYDSHPMDVASQEAMGDYSKPQGLSDSDSDLRNSFSDTCYDEYNQSWLPNQYKPYSYNYDGILDTAPTNEFCESQDYGDGLYTSLYCERGGKPPNMMSIIEETNSQIAVEEDKSDIDDEYDVPDRRALTF